MPFYFPEFLFPIWTLINILMGSCFDVAVDKVESLIFVKLVLMLAISYLVTVAQHPDVVLL